MQPRVESTSPVTVELPYRNRAHAARALVPSLRKYARRRDVIVLALPRGGVPVGYELSKALDVPLDLMIVRKLGFPGHEELAAGAIASGGIRVMNESIAALANPKALAAVEERETRELQRRERLYRGDRPSPELTGKVVILVDDGLATGATMSAAVQAVRMRQPAKVVVAVPVAPADTVERLSASADEVVCPATPEPFYAIGPWYRDFRQVDDAVVRDLLSRSWERLPDASDDDPPPRQREVVIDAAGASLAGTLTLPDAAAGLVIFAHGSGSSRFSTRNQHVARCLNEVGLATLLFDLLTEAEESVDELTRELRFDIELLTERVSGTVDWAGGQAELAELGVGLFGASTGAAAALCGAAARPAVVRAVVSRGGRPDLADRCLSLVRAPTLLIVGSRDVEVLALNRAASRRLTVAHELAVVPGASHLFQEPGTLDEVARLASVWFLRHLAHDSAHAAPSAPT